LVPDARMIVVHRGRTIVDVTNWQSVRVHEVLESATVECSCAGTLAPRPEHVRGVNCCYEVWCELWEGKSCNEVNGIVVKSL
jgi:hypothetical protein